MVKKFTKIIFSLLFVLLLPTATLATNTVIIDPGHGGPAKGTCGFSGRETGICEKDVNLLVSLKLKEVLEANSNFSVHLTRENDHHLIIGEKLSENDLESRVRIANKFAADNNDHSLFVSVHHNQDVNSSNTNGIETYYYDGENHYNPRFPPDPMQLKYLPESKRLGELVHRNLLADLERRDRELRNDQSFYVIRMVQMPAVLVELGFMTNPDEEALIVSHNYQQLAANALAESIIHYFQQYDVLDGEKKLATFQHRDEAMIFAKEIEEYLWLTVVDTVTDDVIFQKGTFSFTQFYESTGVLSNFIYLKKLYDLNYQTSLLSFINWNDSASLFAIEE